jgi:hypothetical protein
LVIGEDPVKLLAPYHEFECTGEDDEYVQEIDETTEYRENYQEERVRLVELASGERVDWYADRFYDAERTKRLPTPEGAKEIEVAVSETKSFTQHVLDEIGYTDPEKKLLRPGQERTEDHKYSFIEMDQKGEVVRVVKRTNPNSHWDGWTLGGRFSQFFKLKAHVDFDIDHVGGGTLYTPADGIADMTGSGEDYYKSDYCVQQRKELVERLTATHATDHARIRDIDFEAGRDRAEQRARENFAKWREIYEEHGKPLPFEHFKELEAVAVAKLEEQGIADEQVTSLYDGTKHKVTRKAQERERAQMAYNAQGAIKAERDAHLSGFRSSPMELFGYDEDAYAAKMRNKAMIPYAVIKDGEWFAKGDMGWWGMSDDHMTDEEWCAKVHELYDELPEDALLTLVDCHV